jgi:phage shock protein E
MMFHNSLRFVAFLAICGSSFAAETPKESLTDVKKDLQSGKAILIDVREIDEWNDGHLREAKSLPLSELKKGLAADKLKTLIPKGKVIYLHCAAGVRSFKAADELKKAGIETKPLKAGYSDLLKAGFEQAK